MTATIDLTRASAGSGKTYKLSHYYIDLLMDAEDDEAYRHILAVTFTNKATDEMKGRILKDLFKLSQNPKETPKRRDKARRVLGRILHDYGAFSVSTIDKFFQKTLRAFARELGQMATYQVELDKEMLCDKAVDTILDELDGESGEDAKFIEYVMANVNERLMNGKAPLIEDALKSMAKRLKSEAFSEAASRLGLDVGKDYSTERLKKIWEACEKVTKPFEDGVKERAKRINDISVSAGLKAEDYSGGGRSWFNKIKRMAEEGTLEALNEDKALNPEKWFAAKNAHLLDRVRGEMEGPVAELVEFYNSGTGNYGTAGIIRKNLYGLGIAARLYNTFNRILKEENLLCLDESNSLLSDIIGGSDAPFIYEKTGVRLEHFLLDEFQDTSVSQWSNFVPLLRESKANGNRNLIVGDVKQSIYRWRNSDWSLLDTGVERMFPKDVHNDPLTKNFRSFQAIVDFNNDFYKYASSAVDGRLADALPAVEGRRSVTDIYSDVEQTLGKPERQSGMGKVDVTFCDDREGELDRLVEVVRREKENGFRYGDIAVLVRCNDDGAAVAQRLVAEGIEVITEAALCIKNSITVRRLVSLMACVNSTDDGEDTLGKYLAGELGIKEKPASYHGLTDLCETLYASLYAEKKEDCQADVTYVTAFMDYVMDCSKKNGDNVTEFLRDWETANPTIQSPLDSDAVKILSIHKSKGLSFPYVILPFIEQIRLFRPSEAWCSPDPEKISGTPLEGLESKLFDVQLSSTTVGTAFEKYYQEEVYNQGIDAINLMYVATTRAECGMELIAENKSSSSDSDFAGILKSFCDGGCRYVYDRFLPLPPEEDKDEKKEEAPEAVCFKYEIHPLGERLSIRPYAGDFFVENGSAGEQSFNELSFRNRGTVLHDILSRVKMPSDVADAVQTAVLEGTVGKADAPQIEKFLSARIASHPEFFPCGEGVRVLNETSITGADGREYRADRVVIRPDGGVLIVDYKFGRPNDEYEEQIRRYKSLYEAMGYTGVSACLWFVYQNKVL